MSRFQLFSDFNRIRVPLNKILLIDIGLDAYESLPHGPKVIAGLLACRASGLSIISLADLAPALQFVCLFVCSLLAS